MSLSLFVELTISRGETTCLFNLIPVCFFLRNNAEKNASARNVQCSMGLSRAQEKVLFHVNNFKLQHKNSKSKFEDCFVQCYRFPSIVKTHRLSTSLRISNFPTQQTSKLKLLHRSRSSISPSTEISKNDNSLPSTQTSDDFFR